MIRVLFFASIREQLECSELEVAFPGPGCSVDTLRAQLIEEHGQAWSEALEQDNVITAINQTIVAPDAAVSEGDEVAFFPPVTGG